MKTGLYFIGLRVSVLRRATLDDVTNVYLFAAQLNGFDNFGQQLPRWTDKWFTLLIFFKTRTFPNKYDFS